MAIFRYLRFFVLNFIEDEDEEPDIDGSFHRIHLRTVRDMANPFSLSERTFVKYFRLTRAAARELIDTIAPYGDTRRIPFDLAVLGSLMFLAKGSYQKNVGISSFYSVSQPTVSRNLHHVVDLINEHILPRNIRFPETDAEFAQEILRFQESYGGAMPEVFGVIDGTLIAIHSPPIHSRRFPARVYRCRKGYPAINALVITSANGKFLYVNARYPGSVHDAAIFRTSLARLKLVTEYQRTGRTRGILLGDQGFATEPFIFPPFPAPVHDENHRAFNRAHKIVRMGVENCIGILKIVFRAIFKDRAMHYHPTFAGQLIYAAASLHNFRVNHRVNGAEAYDGSSDESSDESDSAFDDEVDEDSEGSLPEEVLGAGINDGNVRRRRNQRHPGELFTEEGLRTRERYIRNHFFNRR